MSQQFSAQGSVVVRRRPKDGEPGEKGAKPWFSTYAAGNAYRSGAAGEEYYDIVFVGTLNNTVYNQYFRCLKSYTASETHTPSQGATTTYWEYLQGYDTMVADMLLANNAFINNLTVRKLRVLDANNNTILYAGDASYPLLCGADTAAGATTKISYDGKITTSYITATGGSIAGFTIATNHIGTTVPTETSYMVPVTNGMSLHGLGLCVRDGFGSASAAISLCAYINPTKLYPGSRGLQVVLYGAGDSNLRAESIGVRSDVSGFGDDENNVAFSSEYGLFKGFRPYTRTTSGNSADYLGWSDSVLICGNSGSKTVYLPSSPKLGQVYIIYHTTMTSLTINGNGKTIAMMIHDGIVNESSITSKSVETMILSYNGTKWFIAYIYR